MSLMMEPTLEAARGRPARWCAPGQVERRSGERGDVLAWLTTRAAALRHEGCAVRRVRYRQRRRRWAGKIAYDAAPLIGPP